MFIAAEMTLAGVPALKMPDNWPCYDVAAQPTGGGATQRISVKSRTFKRGGGTFVTYKIGDQFDWLAIVLLPRVQDSTYYPRSLELKLTTRERGTGLAKSQNRRRTDNSSAYGKPQKERLQ